MRLSVTFFALNLAVFGLVAEAGTVGWRNYSGQYNRNNIEKLEFVQETEPDFSITCEDESLTAAVQSAQAKFDRYVKNVNSGQSKEKVSKIQAAAMVDDIGGIKITLYRIFPDRWNIFNDELLVYIQPGSKCLLDHMTIR
jgi:hypothetical protein